eukprot:Sspe_Gene.11944::Locus_4064_Transcript_1_1_Confidence_1.000_Length_432::g.11944::m.11944
MACRISFSDSVCKEPFTGLKEVRNAYNSCPYFRESFMSYCSRKCDEPQCWCADHNFACAVLWIALPILLCCCICALLSWCCCGRGKEKQPVIIQKHYHEMSKK